MRWSKQGVLVPAGAAGPGFSLHTQVPVLDCHRSAFTLYFSARDAQGRSLPFATELLRSGSGFSGSGRARPLSLNLGAEGEFDEHGVMPTALIRRDSEIWLYYIGWSRRGDYPYTNNIGLATSADGKRWHKQGRVMFDSESLYTGTLEVVPAADGFLGYYLACDGWLPAEQDIPAEARYCLRIAASENGLKWRPLHKTAIGYSSSAEGGIGSARLISCADNHHMFYCSRGQRSFRTDRTTSYRIGYACSEDLLNWQRKDELMTDFREQEDWASLMQCFPCIYLDEQGEKLWMFYNGNGFGQTGIGLASLPAGELPGV